MAAKKKKNALKSKPYEDKELAARRAVTFEQAEGAETVPVRMSSGIITAPMRAQLWQAIYSSLSQHYTSISGTRCVTDPWLRAWESR
jgi:hypothetical protein